MALVGRGLAAVLTLSAAATAYAQEDPARVVQRQTQESARFAGEWLASPDSRIRAWGAFVAARDRLTSTVPTLTSLVSTYAGTSPGSAGAVRDEHDSMLGVLDALIQLEARIPLAVAARLYDEFPGPSLIFLSHGEPSADTFLLEILRREDDDIGAWVTAGNLLLNRKPAGFAAHVLGGFRVDVRVRAVDAGGVPEQPGGVAGSCASGAGGPRSGWPPVGTYYVSQHEGTLLSRGVASTTYIRIVGAAEPSGRRADFVCGFPWSDWNGTRERFLARLAGDSPDSPVVKSRVNETLRWQNDAQYARDLTASIRRQQALLDGLATRLVNAGVLTMEERLAARPSIAVTVTDARSIRRSPLPVPQNADPGVTIVNQ